MPEQEEHDKPENLVESPHKTTHSARSLQEAVNSNSTLEGLYAMNDVKDSEELEKEAAEDPGDADRERGHPIP
jgi:hypothetical protein